MRAVTFFDQMVLKNKAGSIGLVELKEQSC
jgi:hypothetical protein